MKHFTFLLIVLCSLALLFHPGRTDENGGHTDHSTGEYHYHHGFPAHQHPNGICTYENSEPIYTNGETTRSATVKSPWWKSALWAISPFAFVGLLIAVFKGIEIAGDKIIQARKDRFSRILQGKDKR